MVNTWLADQTRIHIARMGESLSVQAQEFISGLAFQIARLTPDTVQALALAKGEFFHIVARNALTSAFDEVFQIMAWMFIAALVMVPFCRSAPLPAAAAKVVDAH